MRQISLISNAGMGASGTGRNRATTRRTRLAKAHKKVTSRGELFLRALAIEDDLARRIRKEPRSKTLVNEKQKHERLVSQLAREYKNAIAEYLAAIRAA